MEPLTDADLEAMRAANKKSQQLKAEALPEPWWYGCGASSFSRGPGHENFLFSGQHCNQRVVEGDARIEALVPDRKFIVHARNDPVEDRVDRLMAEVERLRKELRLAVVTEREACALIAERHRKTCHVSGDCIAEAIRTQGME